MTRSAKVRAFFGDREHDFALLIGQCVELQELTDCGLGECLSRVEQLRVKEMKEVIRLGLVGAGMDKHEAFRLMERHVVAGELGVCGSLAFQIVAAAITGAEDEPLGESKGDGTSESPSPAESSDGPSSTAPPPPPASRRRK